MKMNPEQEQFEPLRRLLALKRHEQPPPGYFDNFSKQVIIGIRASQSAHGFSLFAALSWEAPWLQRLLAAFQSRPILAGGFGFAACALLLGGLLFTENLDTPPELSGRALATGLPQVQIQAGIASSPFLPAAAPVEPVSELISTGPRNDSLFQQLKELQAPRRALLINATAPGSLAP